MQVDYWRGNSNNDVPVDFNCCSLYGYRGSRREDDLSPGHSLNSPEVAQGICKAQIKTNLFRISLTD
jgi:hypothetical protein